MREIVVVSGKGGTGKTSLSASFAVLGGSGVVVADCDVDASDLHLVLAPESAAASNFYAGRYALIDADRCSGCGVCADVCRFGAVGTADGVFTIDPAACEGCGYCARVCPTGAIRMEDRLVGSWYRSTARTGAVMIHARLDPGGENSGKLVAKVKGEAARAAEETGVPILLVDGAPGIGCPVVSSLSGADLAVFVTEATVSGFHDLERVHRSAKRFALRSCCIVNKADLNPDIAAAIKSFLAREGIVHLADIPYDEDFTRAMAQGATVVEYGGKPLSELIARIWTSITRLANARPDHRGA